TPATASDSVNENTAPPKSAGVGSPPPPPRRRKFWFLPTKSRFISFSQVREDWILYNAFGEKQSGFYIDVGAADPHSLSVTKLLYSLGWCGINIEPRPDMFAKLQEARPRDVNVNLGCSDQKSELEFAVYGDLSSCDPQTIDSLRQNNADFTMTKTPVWTLTEILQTYLPTQDQAIDFCKIDVEGYERYVLLGLDFAKFRPAVFCVESTIPGSSVPCHKRFEDVLVNNGYEIVYIYSINRYYVDMRRDDAERILENFLRIGWKEKKIKTIDFRNMGDSIRNFIRYPKRALRPIGRSIKDMLRLR
ncbi:MAG: FkbM family methyltransferase, partial [Helicobacteraceae bacterium]|nr:FkbM family methyltransferase [Helicobacteraceae bacterium]